MSKLTADEIKVKIRAEIRADNLKGIWWNFWRSLDMNSL